MSDTCRNCGASYGLHHYKTMQCPTFGKESPIGTKQQYQTSVFEPGITYDELLKQRDALLEACKIIKHLTAKNTRLKGEKMEDNLAKAIQDNPSPCLTCTERHWCQKVVWTGNPRECSKNEKTN
ncbi:MAG TPA: hypothetical protein VMV77_01255 [Bacteroidales bacterium]|nr:hypothetical protein [Bacteroidales bacterium]